MTLSIPKSREETPMKYALESLPELIGERDFQDLCLLFDWHKPHHQPISGDEFARHVAQAAFTRRHQARDLLESRKLSASALSPNQDQERT